MKIDSKSLIRGIALAMVFSVSSVFVTGCDQDGPMESAGEEIDEAVEETGENLEDAGDEVEDEVEDARDG